MSFSSIRHLPSHRSRLQLPKSTAIRLNYRVFDWNRIDPTTGKPRRQQFDDASGVHSFDAPAYAERPLGRAYWRMRMNSCRQRHQAAGCEVLLSAK
jgi:hypothetical protein